MTAKEYLKQAYLLYCQVDVELHELENLRDMQGRVQGCFYGEHIGSNPNRNTEAPFIRTIEKIMELETTIRNKVAQLVDLKKEINAALDNVEDKKERILLKYRYLGNRTWEDIAEEMGVSYRTVHRIHASALRNFKIPE